MRAPAFFILSVPHDIPPQAQISVLSVPLSGIWGSGVISKWVCQNLKSVSELLRVRSSVHRSIPIGSGGGVGMQDSLYKFSLES